MKPNTTDMAEVTRAARHLLSLMYLHKQIDPDPETRTALEAVAAAVDMYLGEDE
jgi:hypothetical protein